MAWYSISSARTSSVITAWLYWQSRSLISVLRRARSDVHSRRKRRPQAYSRGSAVSRTRIAVSAPRSDCQSMRGARGEAHANEWPGAMIPALPPVASSPTASFSSTSVTSWPALARKYAVVTPTTPPPRTSVFIAGVSRVEEESGPHGIGRIEQELAEAGEIGRPRDLRQDRGAPLYRALSRDAPREVEAEEPAAHERVADGHHAAVVKQRHARARAGAAGCCVHLARARHQRVGRHALRVRQLVDEDVVHGGLADARDVDAELGVHRLADGHPALGDPLDLLAPDRDADVLRLHDGEDVADTDRDVERDLADALDLHHLIGQGHERGRPLQRDGTHAIALRAGDRLHGAGLGVDDDPRLGALALDHPGLDRHCRRADRALAAGDVIAAGIDEEQPELRAGRHRLGHHRDQHSPVTPGLQAEARSEMVEMLLEPPALVRDGGTRQVAKTAREEPHPDPGRVEIDGRQQSIRAHVTSELA